MAEIHEVDGIREDRSTPPPAAFNLLYYGLIIWGVLFCAYYLFSGWSSEAEFVSKMAAHQARVTATAGETTPADAGR